MTGRRNNRLRLPSRLRSWKPLVTVAVAVLAGLLAADSKTGARTGAVNAVTAVLEDLFLFFWSDDFGDASAPPDWIEVDEDEAVPAAPAPPAPSPSGQRGTDDGAPEAAPAKPAKPSAPSAPKAGKISLEAASSSTYYVASWNVENLFDNRDDPGKPGDDEFLAGDPSTRWTSERLEQKLSHIAQVIRYMNGSKGPDILGLVEIETPALVEDLIGRLRGRDYAYAYGESPDRRGIDVALLYDRRRFTCVGTETHRVPRPAPLTRVILHVTLAARGGARLHCFVNHWPSRGIGVEESIPQRRAAARVLRREIEALRRREPSAAVLAFGDFNDTPEDASIAETLRALPPPPAGAPPAKSAKADTLYNLSQPLSRAGQGTHAYCARGRKEWQMLDQILASAPLLQPASPLVCDPETFEIVRPPCMLERHGWRKGAPIPTFQGEGRYRGGFSDHLPVAVRLNDGH
ncbi:MAG: endonuclease/exonuclease/phosphatase family protein [Kiritimatiellae bacterium]|nr:endonuclease/exonuclease/phosphatase family protein [Kiritimatiellia bacterium]